jgi:hypothetical protein
MQYVVSTVLLRFRYNFNVKFVMYMFFKAHTCIRTVYREMARIYTYICTHTIMESTDKFYDCTFVSFFQDM